MFSEECLMSDKDSCIFKIVFAFDYINSLSYENKSDL